MAIPPRPIRPGRTSTRSVVPATRKGPPIDLTPMPSPVIPDIDPSEPDPVAPGSASGSAKTAAAATTTESGRQALPSDQVDEAGNPSSGGSSRRGLSRKSRRSTAQSSARNPPVKKSARLLSPAEQIAKRKARNAALRLAGIMVLVLLVAGGLVYLVQRNNHNPAFERAMRARDEGKAQRDLLELALDNHQVAAARAAYDAGLKALKIPELANSQLPISPDDHAVVDIDLARNAAEIKKGILAQLDRIDRIDRDQKVDSAIHAIDLKMKDLSTIPKADLDDLAKHMAMFLANPVNPESEQPNDYKGDYRDAISDMKNKISRVEQETARRLAAQTSDPLKLAQEDINPMVTQEQFNDALTKLDEYKGKFTQADFEPLREFVNTAAKNTWEQAQTFVKSRMEDYKSPGIPQTVAKQALVDARNRLDDVIKHFGIDDYVNQAKSLLATLPQP